MIWNRESLPPGKRSLFPTVNQRAGGQRGAANDSFQSSPAAGVIRDGFVIAILELDHVALGFEQSQERDLAGDIGGVGGLDVAAGGGEDGMKIQVNDARWLSRACS